MTTLIPLNDGTSIPWLAFGTGTALYRRDAADSVTLAIANGFTHLDCAQSYGNEESLGAGIKASGKPRSELYIVTKMNRIDEGQSVRQSLEASLRRLGVDHIDLFLIHNPLPWLNQLKQVWREMEDLKRAGLTNSIGVSNFTAQHLAEICEGATILPAVNQIELHPYVLKAAQPILDFCREHGIVMASYGGQTPLIRVPDGPVSPILERIREVLENTIGSGVTAGQVLLKWIQQKGAVIVTTTSKESRLKEYLDVVRLPDIAPEDMRAIDEAGAMLHHRVFLLSVFNDMNG